MDLSTDTLWFEVAIICAIFAVGNIFFGHFEVHTPKFRRVLKLLLFNVLVVLISHYLGREWFYGLLGIMVLGIIYIHGIVLPRKGINGLTGEPKSKYYEMRGWTRYLTNDAEKKEDEK